MKQIWRLFAATIGAAWFMISPAKAGDLTILHMNDHHSHLQADDGRLVDTYLDYAQSFVDYVQQTGSLKKLPISDYSTQRYR